jgi:ankyrin repeat protein
MGVAARAVDLELQRAAKAGNIKLVRQLLGRGARLCAQDRDGWTALHAAAAEGRASVIEVICSVVREL